MVRKDNDLCGGKHPNRLRKAREERGASQPDLARMAGVSMLSIIRIEAGGRSNNSTKVKILKALGIDQEDWTKVFPNL